MTQGFRRYQLVGHKLVEGWVQPEVLTVLKVLDEVQRANHVGGAIAEIGVHYGRLFIALHLLKRQNESSVAIDVFGDQDLNIDNSGFGDFARFSANVDRWASSDGLSVHQGDSTKLTADELLALAGAPVRLFSVDGGHTESIVLSDMQLAEATLADGGVVIADDVFNPQWPGVSVGTLRYLDQGGELVPFMIGFNKVLFARAEYCDRYRRALSAAFDGRVFVENHSSHFAGHEVLILIRGPRTPVTVLRCSPRIRSAYHRLVRRDGRARE